MQLILLSSDLMLASAIQGLAKRHGATLSTVSTAEAAIEASTKRQAVACVADLRHLDAPIGQFVADVRRQGSADTMIVAVDQHVHEQRLASARAAGCDAVFTRGDVERRLNELLAAIAGQ